MRFPPPEVIATWPEPNYVDPERRGLENMIIQIVLIILVTIFVAARLYARLAITKAGLGWDDATIIGAWMFAVGLTVGVVLAMQNYGWDVHIWDLPPRNQVISRKVSWMCLLFYGISNCLTKASILIFYLRILVEKFDKLVTKITLIVVVVFLTVAIFVLFFECRPFGYYWQILVPGAKGSCIDEGSSMVTISVITLVLDVTIFVIPFRSLARLKIRMSQKLQVLALFSAGLLVIAACSVRVYYSDMVYFKTYDVTWHGYTAWLWTAVEVHVSIICACVPSCRAFISSWNRSSSQTGRTSIYPGRTKRNYGHIDGDAGASTMGVPKEGIYSNVTIGGRKIDHIKGGATVQMEVLQYKEGRSEG
ncbi:Uncharacterized protein BP5553_07847 [Venustampulla echinocandica]|uniref:Rhodopsin domain-containing protein n=1 Tax=Venustampulla echinocandica TaxID=2656787 RepID=A0A370THP2_9HELO|nr:Uncharacterized protein BP5553_07847 [Venustampulla echinocandica]RDL34719.1 Uncharacterized protein BP5553_07847 [Venustampulla echinocandica]